MAYMRRTSVMAWGTVLLAGAALVFAWAEGPPVPGLSTMLFWIVLLLGAELLPVSLGFHTRVTMSFPITVAIAALFHPAVSMTITAIGAFDTREFRREIPVWRALFNRAQLVLAVGAAAVTIDQLSQGSPFAFPAGAGSLTAGVIVHLAVNLGLVSLMLHQDLRIGLRRALETLLPKPVAGFLLSQAALGSLGVATAAAYRQIEFFVAAFLIPLLFARLSLLGARAQQELSQQVQAQQRILLEATEKVFEDRESERHTIAAKIHDSALQLLVGAAYASGNSMRHLREGRLEDARNALAAAQGAMEDAIADLRDSVTDLSRTSIEEGGLMDTIHAFVEQMRVLWAREILVEGGTEEEPLMPVSLAAIQIVQEGLTNALKHADGQKVMVRLSEYDGMVHIEVEDEGSGFEMATEPAPDHLGLRLMKERAARVGGRLELAPRPGGGTRLEAILPGRAAS